jgi:uncharacterized protein (UPF0333 family)
MAAITPTNVRAIRGNVVDLISGTTNKNYMLVEIHATTTANSNTYDISGDISAVSGIVGPVVETIDEAVAATASTWSGSTVTFAGHTGSGRYRGVFLVEVQ